MKSDSDLYMLLGEMSSDIKNILCRSVEQDTRLDNHSNRITAVEKFQWKLIGMATAISAFIGLGMKLL